MHRVTSRIVSATGVLSKRFHRWRTPGGYAHAASRPAAIAVTSARRREDGDTGELSFVVSRYDELVIALMLPCRELNTARYAAHSIGLRSKTMETTAINTPEQAPSIHTLLVSLKQVRDLWDKMEREYEICSDLTAIEGSLVTLPLLQAKYDYCY
ncbi:GM11097 [Drosophila sechellia]|uniref:GM11097 n=1 Tax=Drosophila sechellia TaxID=7238 RepID=B4ILK0_DROSE|nr:GM11097 [Drosophila sechellia]